VPFERLQNLRGEIRGQRRVGQAAEQPAKRHLVLPNRFRRWIFSQADPQLVLLRCRQLASRRRVEQLVEFSAAHVLFIRSKTGSGTKLLSLPGTPPRAGSQIWFELLLHGP